MKKKQKIVINIKNILIFAALNCDVDNTLPLQKNNIFNKIENK